jgi:CBS domain-containing protein
VVVIDVDCKVSEALNCFSQYAIHHLPIVSKGRLVGMLSSVDLMKLKFLAPRAAGDLGAYLDGHVTIEQLMRSPVTSLRPHNSLQEACDTLIKAGSMRCRSSMTRISSWASSRRPTSFAA